jgi:hypothetical protein
MGADTQSDRFGWLDDKLNVVVFHPGRPRQHTSALDKMELTASIIHASIFRSIHITTGRDHRARIGVGASMFSL